MEQILELIHLKFFEMRDNTRMDILLMLIPVSFLLAGGALVACIWAIRSGQYDDVDSPAQKLIIEDIKNNP